MMKIGLIAMSGVRACDPELLEIGLTLPGFVERSKTIASLQWLLEGARQGERAMLISLASKDRY